MSFLSFSIIGYLLLSVEAVLSKWVLTGRLKSWELYVFYVGIFSVFSFFLAPLGLEKVSGFVFWLSFISGIIFLLAMIFLFKALYVSTATRVYVLFGSITTITTFGISEIIMQIPITFWQVLGVILLLLGGFFISYKFHEKRFSRSWKKIVIAGILAGASLVMLKIAYENQNFVSGYIYSRGGIVFATLLLLVWPNFRRAVLKGLSGGKKKNAGDFFAVVGTKSLAGLGTVAVQYGVFLGSVTIVSALVSVQYLLTFIFSAFLSIRYRKIFQEELSSSNLFFKFVGVGLVIAGVIFVNF